MRRGIGCVVSVFAICTFVIGFILQSWIVFLCYTYDVDPSFVLLYALNLFTILPIFGVFTYLRYTVYGTHSSLTGEGYFAWAFPFLYPAVACSKLVFHWYSEFWHSDLLTVVCGVLFAVAVAVNHYRLGKRARDEGGGSNA
jgi:hypothetical protein